MPLHCVLKSADVDVANNSRIMLLVVPLLRGGRQGGKGDHVWARSPLPDRISPTTLFFITVIVPNCLVVDATA